MGRVASLGCSALLALAGCSATPKCDAKDQVLAASGQRQLTCGQADLVADYVAALAGRPVGRRSGIHQATKATFEANPQGFDGWLTEVAQRTSRVYGLTGLEGAEERSHLVWLEYADQGLITHADPLWPEVHKAVAVWSQHDGDQLALAEADIEGWIYYGSLCREVQGGGVLRLSVSDRVSIYHTVQERWKYGSKADRVALTAVGPYWSQVKRAWKAASYDTQAEWAVNAPLPPPMTATSLGYQAAIVEGNLIGHATVLHASLGPLIMATR